jgi:CHAT domain-containing protein
MRRLAAAGEEAEQVGEEARLAGAHVTVFADGTATEAALRGLGAPPAVLHLATHGFFVRRGGGDGSPEPSGTAAAQGIIDFDDEPEVFYQSGFVLDGFGATLKALLNGGPGRAQPEPERDGFLFAQEAAALGLEGTGLVTVSACQSGLGVAAEGEGIVGLARAFAQAGASDVLLTLWPVSDRESPAFMRAFYRRLTQANGDAPRALWETQRSALSPVADRHDDRQLRAAVPVAGAYVVTHRGALTQPPTGDPTPPPTATATAPPRPAPPPPTGQPPQHRPLTLLAVGLALALAAATLGAVTRSRQPRR